MNKYPILIEIGCEDLPPEMMTDIERIAAANFTKILDEKRIKYKEIKIFITPRRIAVKVLGMSSHQEPVVEKVKGPPAAVAFKDGSPTQAGLGFAGKLGVNFKDLQLEETPKGKYYCCIKEFRGKSVKELICDILKNFLGSFGFSVTMRWPGYGIQFPRPIRWFLVKMGKNCINLSFGNLKSSKTTRGHYVFSDKNIAIDDIKEYEKILKQNYVLVNPKERKDYLRKAIDRPLSRSDGSAVKNEKLLEEVNNSLEFPTGIKGEFPQKYLEMPREVIEACLIHHQKYFPVEDEDGKLMNCFIGVRDGISEYINPIRKGYERVLIARLEDAEFFLKQDRQYSLKDYAETLSGIEFTRGLGTLHDKVGRYTRIAEYVAENLSKTREFIDTAVRIAMLSKADLVTHMVGEFPELEGKIGGIYAELDKEKRKVSEGICQHYQPRTYEDDIPKIEEAAVVGIADRVDTLVGNFGTGVEATGSQDPFGMRRTSRGLIRILVEKKWNLDLWDIIKVSRKEYTGCKCNFTDENMSKLKKFMLLQIKNFLEENFTHDVVRCVLSSDELNPNILHEKAKAIAKVKESRGFDSLVTAFKRINNILKQADEKKVDIPEKYTAEKLKEKAEKELNEAFRITSKDVHLKMGKKDFNGVLKNLASLRKPVDMFFNEVLVMDPNKDIMRNRLAMLKNIVDIFDPIGDISKLEVKLG